MLRFTRTKMHLDAGDEDRNLVMSLCMRAIIKLAGIKLSERRKLVAKKPQQMKQPKIMMATVTNLVRSIQRSNCRG